MSKEYKTKFNLMRDIDSFIDLANVESLFVCGLGNRIRGDDALGIYILNSLIERFKEEGAAELDMKGKGVVRYKKENNSEVYFIKCGNKPENFISSIADLGPDALIMVDATNFEGEVGDLVVEDPRKVDKVAVSTHRIPLHILVSLIERRCDCRLESVLVGIQPKSSYLGKEMSTAVKDSSDYLISILNELIQRW